MSAVKLAILYAAEDTVAATKLRTHLAVLWRQGRIEFTEPEEAAHILVLLSAHLVANLTIAAQIEAALSRGALVAPVRYSACEIPRNLDRFQPAGPRTGWIAMAARGFDDQQWAAVAGSTRHALDKASPS